MSELTGCPPIRFEAGKEDDFSNYEAVFADSPLYRNYFSDDDRLKQVIRGALNAKELVVVLSGDEVVGVMEVRFKGFFGAFPYLALLGVKKGWRGKGIGRQMLIFFEEASRQIK